jgi:hypothetical protein
MRLVISAGVTFLVGLFLWAIPMMITSGGLPAYLSALEKQGFEDLAGSICS